MALSAFVQDIETVDESIRGEYKAVEGGFQLDVTEVNGLALENVAGLKSALVAERNIKSGIEREYNKIKKEFEGVDPHELIGIKAQFDDVQTKYNDLLAIDPVAESDKLAELKIKDKMTKAQKDWQKTYDTDIGSREAKQQATTAQLKDLMINSAAIEALSKAGGGHNVELLSPHVLAATRLVDAADGKYVVEVIDPKTGDARVRSDGRNMTIEDLMPEFQTRWPDSFLVEVKPGSGIKGSAKAVGGQSGELTSHQKIQAGLAAMKASQ
jgi:hypothetical protein